MHPSKSQPRRNTRNGTSQGRAYRYAIHHSQKPGYTRTSRKFPQLPIKFTRQQIPYSRTSEAHPQAYVPDFLEFLPSPAKRALMSYYSTQGRPPDVLPTA
eukprot:9861170-Ditylum_brightwellii.AAC.1